MQINERHLHGALVLELQGRLISTASAGLLEAVRRVATAGPSRLVLHLGGVPSIDAAGLGALASAYGVVRSNSGTLRLAHVPERVQKLLDLCRLSSLFGTFDSVEAAIAAGWETAIASCIGDSGAAASRTSLNAIDDWREPGLALR